jgi:ATP-dependent DNA ligase
VIAKRKLSLYVPGERNDDWQNMGDMQWVRPKLVAQIRFVEWTAEGRLRHAAFLGLRRDKSVSEVRRE